MKGQISFDYILALTVALILLTSLQSFSDGFLANQNKISIAMQEKQIANGLQKLFLYAKNLKDADSFGIAHEIPKIFLSSPAGSSATMPISCDINVTAKDINVTVTATHFPKISQTMHRESIANKSGVNFGSTICGTTITVTKNNIP